MAAYSDPFSALLALQRALESRIASGWLARSPSGMGGYPPINIFQQGDNFVAIIELPGMERNNLHIEAKENTIRIHGNKSQNYPKEVSVHRRERGFGAFDRTITLPIPVDANAIRAEYNDGILALFLPPAESAKPRSIEIS
ncbi:MAG: Hsp20/alpha crystallin family protein [Rhizobiales bacterium]|nr:Hsp20/alpha crystallin family protein [Hyphomicrobiales bacterium]